MWNRNMNGENIYWIPRKLLGNLRENKPGIFPGTHEYMTETPKEENKSHPGAVG